jgi:hypothetical protein
MGDVSNFSILHLPITQHPSCPNPITLTRFFKRNAMPPVTTHSPPPLETGQETTTRVAMMSLLCISPTHSHHGPRSLYPVSAITHFLQTFHSPSSIPVGSCPSHCNHSRQRRLQTKKPSRPPAPSRSNSDMSEDDLGYKSRSRSHVSDVEQFVPQGMSSGNTICQDTNFVRRQRRNSLQQSPSRSGGTGSYQAFYP